MRALASGRASPRIVIWRAGGGHHDPSDDPVFMEKFVGMVDSEHRKGHVPDVWVPHKPQKPCLLSPDASTLSPVISTASRAPDVHTISNLQQALKMLGYRITVDGDYGPETRQIVTSFQMHAGNPRRRNCRLTDGSKAAHRTKPLGPPLCRACFTARVSYCRGVGSPPTCSCDTIN